MAITMGTHVVIIDPAHLHYGKVGRVVGLATTPPNRVVFTVDIGIEMVKAAYYQLSTTVQDALDALDSPPMFFDPADPGVPSGDMMSHYDDPLTYDHRTFEGLQRFLEVEGRALDRETPGGYEYEDIGLPPVTNEMDGVE